MPTSWVILQGKNWYFITVGTAELPLNNYCDKWNHFYLSIRVFHFSKLVATMQDASISYGEVISVSLCQEEGILQKLGEEAVASSASMLVTALLSNMFILLIVAIVEVDTPSSRLLPPEKQRCLYFCRSFPNLESLPRTMIRHVRLLVNS